MLNVNPFEAPSNADPFATPATAAPMELTDILFSFDGRIGRQAYWLGSLGLGAAYMAAVFLMAVVGLPQEVMTIGILLMYIPMIWISLALNVKRWHDRDKSGFFVLVGLIPLVGGLWQFVECGLLEGSHGSNSYGADPIAR